MPLGPHQFLRLLGSDLQHSKVVAFVTALGLGLSACSSSTDSPDSSTGAPSNGTPSNEPAATGGATAVGADGTGGSVEMAPVPDGLSGVVVVNGDDDTTSCIPLCTENTDPTVDPEGDDWAFEDGSSCVIPTTSTGSNQACVTGDPLPNAGDAGPVAGVVVKEEGERTCIPLCVFITDAAEDDNDDGWSWENNQSCVIPGSGTGLNQGCMTGEPIPESPSRPGVILVVDAEQTCAPICQIVTESADADASDWGFENSESCVLPGSPSMEGRRDCTFGQYPPDFTPPALTGTKVADGFYTEGGKLYDAYGNEFIMRGVNNAHIWYDGFGDFLAWHALDNIADYGTNTVRIVWETTGGSPELLADILHRTVELGMVPMLELHDVTGHLNAGTLLEAVEYYKQPEILSILLQYREYLLINIANEWSGEGTVYGDTYTQIITDLRAAGLTHNLVIDAGGFGQNMQSIFDNAEALMASDPEKNLLFSIHMYDLFQDATRVEDDLNEAVTLGIPLIVGEFGHQLSGADVAWQQIVDSCQALGLGYIAWSWTGNDEGTAHLDMAEDWEGPLTQWGTDILTGTNGIQETSAPASIFLP